MTRSYFNGKADIWDEKIAEKDKGRLAGMAERLDVLPGDAVLDVGTGTGVFIPFLLEKIGPRGKLVCLDVAEKMLDKARAKNFKGNIDFTCADISSTPFKDKTFDAVVCYSSFPHFRDKAAALKEIGRVLKKGGRLAICHTGSRASINQVHQRMPEIAHDLIPEEKEVRQLLEDAGFGQVTMDDGAESYLVKAVKL